MLALLSAGAGPNAHHQSRAPTGAHPARAVALYYAKQVAAALEEVAFAADHLPLRLARLVHEGLLFAADPEQLRDYSETYGLIVYARWRRYPDTSLWGMNA